MSDSKTIDVTIGGHNIRLRYESEESFARELVDFVKKHLDAMGAGNKEITAQTAIICALNIAEEYFNFRKNSAQVLDQLEVRTRRIQEHLDALSNESVT